MDRRVPHGGGLVIGLLLSLVLWVLFASVAFAQSPKVTQLYPGNGVRENWERVVACSGSDRDTTQTFEQIKFFERDSLTDRPEILGEWVKPDTIYITKGHIFDGWIVSHEMLHHALRGPPGVDPHPMAVFIRCGLASFQYVKPDSTRAAMAPIIIIPGVSVRDTTGDATAPGRFIP